MTPVIIDNLRKFGLDFQTKIIAGILSDRHFLERVLDIVDIKAFENEAHQWILKEIIDYFIQYKEIPTLSVFKIRLDTITNDLLKTSVIDHLKSVYLKLTEKDLVFVREQFLEFCKNQKLKSAILESVDHLQSGQYEHIKSLVDNAMKAGAERNLGHNYNTDIDIRMSQMCRQTVPTNWECIDAMMDGGLGPGELGVFVAPAGTGKSWILAKLGAEAMRQGKNVVHFSMELNENYVGLRYDCCFTHIDFQNIRNNVDVVKEKIKDVKGRLMVKYFPLKTVSAQSLKYHVERIQSLEGIKIDLVIVDYADILRAAEKDKNANSYSDMGNIYEELRTVAGELQMPIWTASQTNRCFFVNTSVSVSNKGIIPAKELVVGDEILTHEGYKPVTEIYPIEQKPTYRIKLKSGKHIDCTCEHRFPVKYGVCKSIQTGLSVGDELFTKK